MTIAVVAEKPSVARDIAQVLGARRSEARGACAAAGYVVTWAIGHLVALAEPHEIDPRVEGVAPRRPPDASRRRGAWSSPRATRDQFDVVRRCSSRPT